MKRILLILFFGFATGTLSAGTIRVYLIGDSTCATKDLAKQNPERGWGQLYEPLFDETVEVENHAVNGRSSRSFREEGRWDPVYEKLRPGDYVFIEFGHNDQKVGTVRYAAPETYAENLRRYIRETREKGAFPVLLSPIVRRHFAADGSLEDTHGEYLAAVRRVAQEESVPFIDAERLTREWVASLGEEASRRYYMWVEPGTCPLYPDGRQDNTHLNVRGAHVVARMIAAELKHAAPELAQRLVRSDWVVARDGSGDSFTIGEAVAAIPDFCRDTTRVVVCAGDYREKVVIPATKRNVVLSARGEAVVTWDDYAAKAGPTGAPLGTSGSATIYFGGDDWLVRGFTFRNTAGRVGQAVAVQCLGDGIHFVGCRFLGDQDTLYLYGSGNRDGQTVCDWTRLWFDGCYIEGTTDFIFGSAAALFRDCEIHAKADSYLTAASTCRGQTAGLVFQRCRLTAAQGVTRCYLGRPWRDYAQTIFIDCFMGAHIRSEGWHDWDKPAARKRSFYAEYGSQGPGAAPRKRVRWAHALSEKEARRVVEAFGK